MVLLHWYRLFRVGKKFMPVLKHYARLADHEISK